MSLMIPDGFGGYIQQPPGTVETLGKQILTALNKAYGPDWVPGWKVAIDTNGGIVQIRNLLISGKMGFQMKITQVDPDMKTVVRFAGELFERYRVSRSKHADVIESVSNIKRNFKGEAVHDE